MAASRPTRASSLLHVPDLIEFITDPQWLGLSISPAQETLLRAMDGLPLTNDEQRELWRTGTGDRPYREGHRFPEVDVLSGARGGKDSRIAAPLACRDAVFGEFTLARGEKAVIPVVAQDARATRIAFGYIREYFRRSPLLAGLIADERANELELTTGVSICCFPCTKASLRGWSIPTAVMDEVAFFGLEGSTESDAEIQTSIRRGMVAFPRTRLVKISTPYLKSGILFTEFERAFGVDDPDLLVWRMSSLLMNPTLKAIRLERERRLDPLRFAREYEAEWVDDVSAFLPPAWVDAAVVRGRFELPPNPGIVYGGTTDPTGGGPDAWPLCIWHVEGQRESARLVIDVLRSHRRVGTEAPDLEGIVREYADVLRQYHCASVSGDRFAGSWVRQAFERCGIRYVDAPCDRSAAYLELQPWLAQGRIELVDQPTLIKELKSLERRPRPGGKDQIDAARGRSEDHANCIALAASLARGADLGPLDHSLMRRNLAAPPATAAGLATIYGERRSSRGLDLGYGPHTVLDFGKAYGS